MAKPEIKICGIRRPEALETAIALGCDYAGMVFYPPSPRHVSMEEAAALAQNARGRIHTVAVVVDAEDALLAAIAEKVRPDFLQLHGNESPIRTAEIKHRFGTGIIKALPVRGSDDVAAAGAFAKVAEILLFDAKPPRHGLPGGNGLSFDWRLLGGREFPVPWFLSGGLNAGNVSEAVRLSGATMLDVSSSVESAPGVKDPNLMKAFVEATREL